MSAQIVSYSVKIDPALAAKIEAKRAKALKPCCTQCRKTLQKRELPDRRCLDKRACTTRAICLHKGASRARIYQGLLV